MSREIRLRLVWLVVIVIAVLAVGFLSGMEYKAYQLRSAMAQAFNAFPGVMPKATPEPVAPKDAQTYVDKGIGDEIELQTFRVKMLSSKEQDFIQSSTFHSSVSADAGTKFIVVSMELTNLTNAGLSMPVDGLPLFDNKGRQFGEYEKAVLNIDNSLSIAQFSPGISKTGVLVYQVPSDATSYYIALGKGGTNTIYRVKLQ